MRTRANGFTLIEMAVVVAVIALLLGGIIVPLAAQVEERRISEMQRLLDETREALAGFAVTNGRLPCPASSTIVFPLSFPPAPRGTIRRIAMPSAVGSSGT